MKKITSYIFVNVTCTFFWSHNYFFSFQIIFICSNINSFLLNSTCCLEFFQRAICSSCFLMHDMGSFFSSCCLETDGKGEVYTKRSQVREGRVHQILLGKHSGVKVSLIWIFMYVYSNGSQFGNILQLILPLLGYPPELKTGHVIKLRQKNNISKNKSDFTDT